AVNLVNRLEDALKTSVPTASLLQGPSVEQLVSDLLPDLVSGLEEVSALEEVSGSLGPASTPGRRDPWLVTVRANPSARVRLFCFPFAGGGSAFFRAWSEALDPSIEVVAIEPPGRLGRIDERPIRDISTFVRSLVPGLTSMLEDKPFAFFGHCLGGLTMFEVTRHVMEETPYRPTHVFASGTRTPDRLVLTDEFERALMEDVLQNEGFVVSRALYEQDDAVFADGIRHFNIDATESLLADPSLRSLLLPTIRAEFEMAYRYRFQPTAAWDVPIVCFAGSQDTYATRDDMLEWRRFTASSFQLFLRQGAHFLLLDDKPFLHQIIARELGDVDAGMDPAATGQRSPVPVA
ncbi:MAG TPA: alpha/beta fold hydrolase, partial [Actinomycetota bacterium]|nr:alpha/beta fold hydrolase [Actinomycetota bacterium]